MKKRFIVFMLLAAVLLGNLFAQEQEAELAKNRIALSLGLIIGDLSYERVLSPYFSLLGQVSYNNCFIVADSLAVSVKGRWYPFGGAFFLDLGLGYSYGYNIIEDVAYVFSDMFMMMLTFGLWALTDEYKSRSGGSTTDMEHGFLIQPGLGWNIDIGKRDGFRLPIALGADVRLTERVSVVPFLKLGLGYSF